MEKLKQNPVVKKLGLNRILLVCILILMFIVFKVVLGSKFPVADSIKSTLNYVYFLGFLSLGVTFVIATGGIDFSIGPVMFCCALISGYCMTAYHVPCALAMVICVLIGFAFGMFNGFMVSYMSVPAFIISMASMNIAKGLAYIAIAEDGTRKSSFAKFMTDEEMDALVAAMDGKAGDLLLFAADKKKLVYDVLGALRLELAKQMDLLDKNEYRFVWVTEFPLLEWSEEENRFTAMHHPFTMPMDEDIPLLDTDPGAVRAKAYDIVLNGNEIGGGSVRIHQDDIQERMFKELGFTPEAAHEQFGFLLDAFKYGVPPHAGLAYGLDRLVMLMAKEDSIRDVIAFPKVKDASCLMTEAPSPVDAVQLEELGLEVEPQAEEETIEE